MLDKYIQDTHSHTKKWKKEQIHINSYLFFLESQLHLNYTVRKFRATNICAKGLISTSSGKTTLRINAVGKYLLQVASHNRTRLTVQHLHNGKHSHSEGSIPIRVQQNSRVQTLAWFNTVEMNPRRIKRTAVVGLTAA